MKRRLTDFKDRLTNDGNVVRRAVRYTAHVLPFKPVTMADEDCRGLVAIVEDLKNRATAAEIGYTSARWQSRRGDILLKLKDGRGVRVKDLTAIRELSLIVQLIGRAND